MNRLLALPCLAVLGAVATQPSRAETIPANLLTAYAGEYALQCTNPAALRAKVSSAGLSLSHGKNVVNGSFEMEALSYMGPNPPAGYETTLMGKAGKLGSFVFVVYRVGGKPAIELELDAPILKKLGTALRGQAKLGKC